MCSPSLLSKACCNSVPITCQQDVFTQLVIKGLLQYYSNNLSTRCVHTACYQRLVAMLFSKIQLCTICSMNKFHKFEFLCYLKDRALDYLSTCIDQVNSFGDIFKLVIVELIYKVKAVYINL
jgi:hypothetical protein